MRIPLSGTSHLGLRRPTHVPCYPDYQGQLYPLAGQVQTSHRIRTLPSLPSRATTEPQHKRRPSPPPPHPPQTSDSGTFRPEASRRPRLWSRLGRSKLRLPAERVRTPSVTPFHPPEAWEPWWLAPAIPTLRSLDSRPLLQKPRRQTGMATLKRQRPTSAEVRQQRDQMGPIAGPRCQHRATPLLPLRQSQAEWRAATLTRRLQSLHPTAHRPWSSSRLLVGLVPLMELRLTTLTGTHLRRQWRQVILRTLSAPTACLSGAPASCSALGRQRRAALQLGTRWLARWHSQSRVQRSSLAPWPSWGSAAGSSLATAAPRGSTRLLLTLRRVPSPRLFPPLLPHPMPLLVGTLSAGCADAAS